MDKAVAAEKEKQRLIAQENSTTDLNLEELLDGDNQVTIEIDDRLNNP